MLFLPFLADKPAPGCTDSLPSANCCHSNPTRKHPPTKLGTVFWSLQGRTAQRLSDIKKLSVVKKATFSRNKTLDQIS
jgi:hypothetical protein